MRIKTQLWIGLLFLTLLSALLIGLSTFFLHQTAGQAKQVVQDNLQSIVYANKMQQALSVTLKNPADPSGYAAFSNALEAQENNITELGEDALTQTLRGKYQAFVELQKKSKDNKPLDVLALNYAAAEVQLAITNIQAINQQALAQKNNQATESYNKALMWVLFGCGVFLVFIISFLVNFPSFIIKPIDEITTKIKSLAAGNLNETFAQVRSDELGEVQVAFNAMTRELSKWRSSNLAEILAEQQRLEALLDASVDGVLLINQDLQILKTNQTVEVLLGLSALNKTGTSLRELSAQNKLIALITKSLDAPNSQEPLSIIVNGMERFYQLQVIRFIPKSNHYEWLIIFRDVTEFNEKDKNRIMFLATVSHELKSPIASINLTLKLLRNPAIGELNPEQQKILTSLEEDTQRLLRLVNQFLQQSTLEAGHILIEKTSTPVITPLNNAMLALDQQAKAKNIVLDLIDLSQGASCQMDVEKTTWVLINLIANSIRYSPENESVTLQCCVDKGQVFYKVKDKGPGIPKAYHKRLFDRYFTVPGQSIGTGLGLSIAKQFLEAQGGNITLESEVGEGALFVATLPIS